MYLNYELYYFEIVIKEYQPGAGVIKCLFTETDRFVWDRKAAWAETLFAFVIRLNPFSTYCNHQ